MVTASLETTKALLERRTHFTGIVKTASKGFSKKFLNDLVGLQLHYVVTHSLSSTHILGTQHRIKYMVMCETRRVQQVLLRSA